MATNFIRIIMARAIENIQKIFQNRHEIGKQIGETAASMALRQIVQHVLVSGQQVKVTEIDRIYIDNDGSINHDGHGHCVAVIYEGDDKKHYKHTIDQWYVWNGSDWT